jgi:hypothetical protein
MPTRMRAKEISDEVTDWSVVKRGEGRMNGNLQVFTGKILVGHIGLFISPDGTGTFPVDEHWRHDLLPRESAVQLILQRIIDGGRSWPQGFSATRPEPR